MADTFKRSPPRKRQSGRQVVPSANEREAYEQLIRDRDERERTYLRNLPSPDNKASK